MSALEILLEILKFQTITYAKNGDDVRCLDYLASICREFEAIRVDVAYPDDESKIVRNLILIKKFGDAEHLSFAGHIDVVPTGSGWSGDAFDPVVQNGYITARGTQDMKSGVAAFVAACVNFVDEIKQGRAKFDGTISMILTSDEEGDGIYGTLQALKFMQQNAILPDFAVVAEPTCDTVFGDTIKVGRRGSINSILTIKGKQGHAAYPEKCINPVHLLATKFSQLAGFDLDNADEFFSASKIVVTDIRGGLETTNVTPSDVRVMFNVRNSPKISVDDIRNYVLGLFGQFDCDLKIVQGSKPFLTDKNSKIVKKMQQSIEKITSITANLNTKGGTSDARYLAEFGVKVVEFGVINDKIHAIDERTSIDEIEKLYEIFIDLLRNFKS